MSKQPEQNDEGCAACERACSNLRRRSLMDESMTKAVETANWGEPGSYPGSRTFHTFITHNVHFSMWWSYYSCWRESNICASLETDSQFARTNFPGYEQLAVRFVNQYTTTTGWGNGSRCLEPRSWAEEYDVRCCIPVSRRVLPVGVERKLKKVRARLMALANFVLVAIFSAVVSLIEETAHVHIVYLTGARNLITPQSAVSRSLHHTLN